MDIDTNKRPYKELSRQKESSREYKRDLLDDVQNNLREWKGLFRFQLDHHFIGDLWGFS